MLLAVQALQLVGANMSAENAHIATVKAFFGRSRHPQRNYDCFYPW